MHAVSNRIDALEHKDFRVHVACSPRHRHSLCLRSLHQSRSFLSLLSGIVLGCVDPKDGSKPFVLGLSWLARLPIPAECWSSTSFMQLVGISHSRFSVRSLFSAS